MCKWSGFSWDELQALPIDVWQELFEMLKEEQDGQ
jgi:hypothetical protein